MVSISVLWIRVKGCVKGHSVNWLKEDMKPRLTEIFSLECVIGEEWHAGVGDDSQQSGDIAAVERARALALPDFDKDLTQSSVARVFVCDSHARSRQIQWIRKRGSC